VNLNANILVPTASAIQIDTGLVGRRYVAVSNAGPNTIWLGPTNAVAIGGGIAVPPGQTLVLNGMDEISNQRLFARASTALQVSGAATNCLEW